MSFNVGSINGFFGEYRFLSNFYMTTIVYDGITYPSSEHAYQAQKTVHEPEKVMIAKLQTPVLAKTVGKELKSNPIWDDVKQDFMRDILTIKFQDPKLRQMLKDTHPMYLEETNDWGDRYWGVSGGKGENHLGLILMEIRREIIN